ncbi:Oligopeptide transport ATP-binding protein OppF [Klebsiella pneumoniae]|uniref:Oligopeptide transport ATP-binding protein OppF n=1 Tax=Klebsiella pneumoniae TaxID=573 RepID=A0A447S8F0_KLEPN|nr:Oligopeptide transport ATP-binding protein OppF [Klebsiella pneumoniae]
MSERYVIEVDGLKKYFPLRDGLFGQQTGELSRGGRHQL